MELENTFTVPVPPADAWRVLIDVERVAPCLPGATLETVEGDSFTGRVKVKVGPINLTYAGEARFSSLDEDSGVAVLEGRGKETRGPGTATATVTCRLSADGDGTRVDVATDLAVTGKPAQFGRGVLADVSSKLVDQFAACLSRELSGGDVSSTDGARREETATAPRAAVSGSVAEGTVAGAEPGGAEPGAATIEAVAPATPADGPEPVTTGRAPAAEAASAATPTGRAAAGAAPPSGPRRVVQQPEADPIDLLGTAGGPVLKRAAPALGALVVLVLLVRWLRSRS